MPLSGSLVGEVSDQGAYILLGLGIAVPTAALGAARGPVEVVCVECGLRALGDGVSGHADDVRRQLDHDLAIA